MGSHRETSNRCRHLRRRMVFRQVSRLSWHWSSLVANHNRTDSSVDLERISVVLAMRTFVVHAPKRLVILAEGMADVQGSIPMRFRSSSVNINQF